MICASVWLLCLTLLLRKCPTWNRHVFLPLSRFPVPFSCHIKLLAALLHYRGSSRFFDLWWRSRPARPSTRRSSRMGKGGNTAIYEAEAQTLWTAYASKRCRHYSDLEGNASPFTRKGDWRTFGHFVRLLLCSDPYYGAILAGERLDKKRYPDK
jgi:hypothetical protein